MPGEEGHRITDQILVKALAQEFSVQPTDVKVLSFEVEGTRFNAKFNTHTKRSNNC